MAETNHLFSKSHLARIESDDRLVVLARTIHARDPRTETALKDGAVNWARFGETCLGQALYRHRTVFQNASEAPVWSHLELSYFRSMVPGDAILDLVVKRQPAAMELLRAEILLTTPSSFVLPRDWQGLADRPERHRGPTHRGRDPPCARSAVAVGLPLAPRREPQQEPPV
jgi:hypothetical protein